MAEDHFLNLQPGTIVNDRYEIVKCLGQGSMGMVYACRHRDLSGHLVAMKVLFAEVARDEVAAARFKNEIVASYGVSHPNVVRAYEYFRDGDLVAFTMEYIGGGDLADKLQSEERIAIPEVIAILAQMCSGVQAIHDAGIIHRDLKPENILLTTQGDIKITDFGIARTGTGPKLTEHGGVVGTIDYVSPEYLESGSVDERSDVYALGVLGYEMITGETPFHGKSVIETMTLRLRTDPDEPRLLRPECPPRLSDIVMRALKRDPRERYQKATEMEQDLRKLSLAPIEPLEEYDEPLIASSGTQMSESGYRQSSMPFRFDDQVPTSEELVDPFQSTDYNSLIENQIANHQNARSEDIFGEENRYEYDDEREHGSHAVEEPRAFVESVSISRSGISQVRLNELSRRTPARPSGFLSWLDLTLGGMILLLGFICGVTVLYYLKPDLVAKSPLIRWVLPTTEISADLRDKES